MKIPKVKFFEGYPVVMADKAREIDRIAVMDYGIKEDTLMENAGMKSALEIEIYVLENLKKDIKGLFVSILCGRGNNGGDGLVCARYLAQKGAGVYVFIVSPSEKGYSKLVVENLEKAKKAGVNIMMVDF
ncbi:MAG: NAD(P)H-hydrate epimerase, partial [Elusimicrobiales bacterium]